MHKKHLLTIITTGIVAVGCSDADPTYTILPGPIDPSLYVLPEDVSGTWYSRMEKNAVNCGMGEIIDAQTIVISQDSEDITMLVSSGDLYVGSVNGDIVEWAGSYFERGGTANFTSATLVFSADSGSGNAAWTWTNGTDSCNGTMALDVAKGMAQQESGSNSHPDVATPFDFVDNVAFFEGTLGNGLDRDDYFAFVAPADGSVQAELSHFDTSSSDIDLYLFDENMNELSASLSVDSFERVEASVTAGTTYYIKAETASISGPESYYLSVDFNN